MTGFRLLVTGSRSWVDIAAVVAVLDAALAEHGAGLVVVHGGCPAGADAVADQWARRRGVPVEVWPADWSALGRRAGMVRNAAMVGSGPDRCVAFIRDASPGATHCAAAAQAAGIPTRRYQAGGAALPGETGRAVAAPVLFADPGAVGWAEVCHCCGMQPVGDRDGVRCGRCSGPGHEFRGWGCGDIR